MSAQVTLTEVEREAFAEVVPDLPFVASGVDRCPACDTDMSGLVIVVQRIVAARMAQAWDEALTHVRLLADPAHSIDIYPHRPLVVMADITQAGLENPYREKGETRG